MRQAPRDRLIDTAAALFYERGLPNVGINEVTDTAGVARMTLYNNFASKEDLALAAFERQAKLRRELIEKCLGASATPEDQLLAMFDVAEKLAAQPKFRGCAFINVAVQDPDPKCRMHELVRAHKDWIRARFRDIAERAKRKRPEVLAQQFLALWDGAIVEAFIQGSTESVRASKLAARILLAARD
jgi:AcrR family transcriptional regulator